MLGSTNALERMKICGILRKNQVLDNEASKSHKDTIRESGITYQLVTPDDHRRKIAENKVKHGKIILSSYLVELQHLSQYTYGANPLPIYRNNCYR